MFCICSRGTWIKSGLQSLEVGGCRSRRCFRLDSRSAPTTLLMLGWARMKPSLHWEVHLLPGWGSHHVLAEERLWVGCLAVFSLYL